LASLPADTLPSLRRALGEALADGLGNESRALQLRLQHADVGYADPNDALFTRHALDLLIENRGRRRHRRPADGSPSSTSYPDSHLPLASGGCAKRPACVSGGSDLRHPVFPRWLAVRVARPRPGGLTIAFSANTRTRSAFAAEAVIAMPIAALLAGVTEFLILDGVDQFPLLAIGMAPVVLAGALLVDQPQSATGLDRIPGARLLPRDPRPGESAGLYPETYLFSSFMRSRLSSCCSSFCGLSSRRPTRFGGAGI